MVRYGIIGAGSIARKFVRDIQLAQDSELIAVASRKIEKAQEFCAEYEIPYAFGTYEEMVQSDLIDAVYVATPHSFHKEHSILAMKHGKHVLCEKPISVNVTELDEMIEVAKESKVLLMEAMWSRFLPSTNYVKEIISSKRFGEVTHLELAFGFEIDEDYPSEGRLLNINLAGGSILDVGIYPVSVMMYLVDKEIKEFHVMSDITEEGIDLDTVINIVFEDDTTATLHSSIAQELDDVGSIYFGKTEVCMKRFYHCIDMKVDGEKVSSPCLGEGFVYQIEAFTKTVEQGLLENDIMTFAETRKVIQFLDLVRKELNIVFPSEKKES